MSEYTSVIGLGQLGMPLLATLAAAGHRVVGFDINPVLMRAVNEAKCPFDEPLVTPLLQAYSRHIKTADSIAGAVALSDVTYVIVPTPSTDDGSFSLHTVAEVMAEIGKALAGTDGYHLVVIVSTINPGDTAKCADILEKWSGKRVEPDIGLVYSPTFIARGTVVKNLTRPDYVLIGARDRGAEQRAVEVYAPVCPETRNFQVMSWVSAEIAKLRNNNFITNKISFANETALLCERYPGADVDDVLGALGHDSRIGPKFLRAGTPFGGPCLPRDQRAMLAAAQSAPLAAATDRVNEQTYMWLENAVKEARGDENTPVAVYGMSYKPSTPSVEESPGMRLITSLPGPFFVYDPKQSGAQYSDLGVTWVETWTDALRQAEIVVLLHPELPDLRPDFYKGKIVIDPWRVLRAKYSLDRLSLSRYMAFGVGI